MAELNVPQQGPQSTMQLLLRSDGNPTSLNCGCNEGGFAKLGSDLEALIRIPDQEYSDVTIIVDGKRVPVHRCILSARCPGLRKIFAELNNSDSGGSSKRELELSGLLRKESRIGYEAFMTVMNYVYTGRMRPLTTSMADVVECCNDSSACAHSTCRPAIDYVLELLCASLVFEIPEIRTLAQTHLTNNLEKYQVEDVLHILKSACSNEASSQLQSLCLMTIASSNLENFVLEKELFGAALEHVLKLRFELGHDVPHLDPAREKQCKRILRALDSDDIELVQLLLDEKKLDLDGARALHYAAAYCDPKTMAELLELGVADTNLLNERGLTVLHVAAWRREPQAIANLLGKGARLEDTTSDNQTALDISRRLAKKSALDQEEYQKDRLCIEILEQAEKKHTVKTPKSATAMLTEPSTEEELMSLVLYLENRVALARLLYPKETDIVFDLSHMPYPELKGVESTSLGFPIPIRGRKPSSVDLNEEPAKRLEGLVGVDISDESKESRLESLRQRCRALQKTVETGRTFFPCFSAVIDKYVLDDMNEDITEEEQLLKKRRYAELKGILQDAFLKGRADMNKKTQKQMDKTKKPRRQDSSVPSSSSSTSSRGTSGSLVTKL